MIGFHFIGLGFEFTSYGSDVTEALNNYSTDFKLTDFKLILKIRK
jgi:hypothetical protein